MEKIVRFLDANKLMLVFVSVHLLVWTLVPALLYGNPPTDALEGIAWGNLKLLGYPKHPFLTPWLTAVFTQWLGVVGWPLYLLAQLVVLVCLVAVWRLAKCLLDPWQAVMAVMLLEGVHYYSISAANFNPNVLMLPLWALLVLAVYYALKQQKIYQWVLVGVFAGLALLCKYESAILIVVIFILMLATREGRESFARVGVYLGLITGLLVFSPNLYYLWQNNFNALHYAVSELQDQSKTSLIFSKRIYQPLEFLVEQAASLLPMLMLILPWYKKQKVAVKLPAFDKRFLLILSFGPLIFTLLLSMLSNTSLVSRWGFPFFSLFGILCVAWLKPTINHQNVRKLMTPVIILMIIEVSGIILWTKFRPVITHKANNAIYFPGKQISEIVNRNWHFLYHSRLPYIIGEYQTVVNIAAFSKDQPIPFFENDLLKSPWVDLRDLKQRGAAIVYLQQGPANVITINNVKKAYPSITHEFTAELASLSTAPVAPIKIWVAFLPPLGRVE